MAAGFASCGGEARLLPSAQVLRSGGSATNGTNGAVRGSAGSGGPSPASSYVPLSTRFFTQGGLSSLEGTMQTLSPSSKG